MHWMPAFSWSQLPLYTVHLSDMALFFQHSQCSTGPFPHRSAVCHRAFRPSPAVAWLSACRGHWASPRADPFTVEWSGVGDCSPLPSFKYIYIYIYIYNRNNHEGAKTISTREYQRRFRDTPISGGFMPREIKKKWEDLRVPTFMDTSIMNRSSAKKNSWFFRGVFRDCSTDNSSPML